MQNHYYVLTISFMSGVIPHHSRRDWRVHLNFPHTLLCRLIYASFIGVLLFSFHYETTTKAKFIFCAKDNGSSTSHEDQLDKDGSKAGEVVQMSVVQSFNIIV